jgi:succinate dehydrogenase/fumarate reductase cytochrome b subunit
MHLDAANPLLPLVTLAAGVFLLIAPRIVSVAVAVYLIVAGLLGLNGIYHFFKSIRSAGPKPRAARSRASALWACRGSRES